MMMFFYPIEDVRAGFIEEVGSRETNVQGCRELEISIQSFYRCKERHMDLPRKVQDKLGLLKVVDKTTVVGYVSSAKLDWGRLWC